MHSVVHHCFDVAACASVLLAVSPPPSRIEPAAVAALVALHDIGKFSRTFQAKCPELWPVASLGAYKQPPPGYPHDQVGLALLVDALEDEVAPLFAGWCPEDRIPILRALAGHHGRPPPDPKELRPNVVCAGCNRAARTFVARLFDVLAPPSLLRSTGARSRR